MHRLVDSRGHGDGLGYLVYALYWDAGVSDAHAGGVRLAHRFAISPRGNFRLCRSLICSKPPAHAGVERSSWQHGHGYRNCADALYRYGRDADGSDVQLQPDHRDGLGGAGDCHLVRGALAGLLRSRRNERKYVAQTRQCRDHGCRHSRHALYRHGGSHVHAFHRSARSVARGECNGAGNDGNHFGNHDGAQSCCVEFYRGSEIFRETSPADSGGGGSQRSQERVSRQHEPRDPHAAQRNYWHDRVSSRNQPERRAARLPRHG